MFKSVGYVLGENIRNLYRIKSISKYELKSSNRDSRIGWFWNILNPLIQICTYWFVFGIGIRNSEKVNGIPFMQWMLAGIIVWFFVSPCITKGTNAIYTKQRVLTKMKFPVSILPTTVVLKEFYNHLIVMGITILLFLLQGLKFDIYNIKIFYYTFCAIAFCISFGMLFSTLNMFSRDVKKFTDASMRMLFYVTPILWTTENLPKEIDILMKCNPINYLVDGYRESLFYHTPSTHYIFSTIVFWGITISLFIWGCNNMYKYRYKFMDLM